MPKTGTSLPLIAQLGFAFIVIAFAIRKFGL
jgi:LPXTG-motif cell wall-anchored protein